MTPRPKQWAVLADLHKALMRHKGKLRCVKCGYSGPLLESDHILPWSKYDFCRYWLINLQLLCKECNQKKGVKVYLTPKSIILLGYYYMIKILKGVLKSILAVFFCLLLWKDIAYHPWETTFTYLIISDAKEAFNDAHQYYESLQGKQ